MKYTNLIVLVALLFVLLNIFFGIIIDTFVFSASNSPRTGINIPSKFQSQTWSKWAKSWRIKSSGRQKDEGHRGHAASN